MASQLVHNNTTNQSVLLRRRMSERGDPHDEHYFYFTSILCTKLAPCIFSRWRRTSAPTGVVSAERGLCGLSLCSVTESRCQVDDHYSNIHASKQAAIRATHVCPQNYVPGTVYRSGTCTTNSSCITANELLTRLPCWYLG